MIRRKNNASPPPSVKVFNDIHSWAQGSDPKDLSAQTQIVQMVHCRSCGQVQPIQEGPDRSRVHCVRCDGAMA